MKIKILYFRVNKYCNAKCYMCDFWKNPQMDFESELFEQKLRMFDGLKLVRFTGGEPLLCSQLPKYIKICSHVGLITSVITNGFILQEQIKELVENGLNQIIISLDASTSDLHDKLRRTPGLFTKIEEAIDRINLKYPSIDIRVNTVVSDKNFYDLPNILKWLEEHKVVRWSIIPIKLENYKWSDYFSLEDFCKQYQYFQKKAKESKISLMGYSLTWAGDIKTLWAGGVSSIKPKGKCHLVKMATFYDPFVDQFYPCNCIPHRNNHNSDALWYYKYGPEYCNGCEPLNAWCSDFPNKLDSDILSF